MSTLGSQPDRDDEDDAAPFRRLADAYADEDEAFAELCEHLAQSMEESKS